MTVKMLKEILSNYDDNDRVILGRNEIFKATPENEVMCAVTIKRASDEEFPPVVVLKTRDDYDVAEELEAALTKYAEDGYDEVDALTELAEIGYVLDDFAYDPACYEWAKKMAETHAIWNIEESIKNAQELVEKVMSEYKNDSAELSEMYFEGLQVEMTKKDFIEAYAEIQRRCNGDIVVRLPRFPYKEEDVTDMCTENLIPDEKWGNQIVKGDAVEILFGINSEQGGEGPIFARLNDGELLDLVYGEYESYI